MIEPGMTEAEIEAQGYRPLSGRENTVARAPSTGDQGEPVVTLAPTTLSITGVDTRG